jgi:hypothetical protein
MAPKWVSRTSYGGQKVDLSPVGFDDQQFFAIKKLVMKFISAYYQGSKIISKLIQIV